MVPCSILLSGLVTQFVPGKVGLVLNLVLLFVNGLGVDCVLSPAGTYLVDILHDRSAEVAAVSMFVVSTVFRAYFLTRPTGQVLPRCDFGRVCRFHSAGD